MRHKGQLIWPGRENGLVLWIPFYEGSGTTAHDLSGYDNHGTIYGATWTNGYRGYGLYFDGVDDYVDCGNKDNVFTFGTNDFTIEAWIKMTDWPSNVQYPAILAVGTTGDGEWMVRFETKTKFAPYLDVTHMPAIYATFLNTWRHIVYVRNGDDFSIYLDGVHQRTDTVTGIDLTSTKALHIGGAEAQSIRFFPGIIDEVRIYNRALTAEEIRKHYLAGLNRLQHGFRL